MRQADKIVIVYGGGSLGSAVATAFDHHGATVHLVARTADEANRASGQATTATVLDVFDEVAVEAHARTVVDRAGGIDVAACVVERGDVPGVRLLDMTVADFTRPLFVGLTATFVTARAVARYMVRQRSGVIVVLNGTAGQELRGGSGPADAATTVLLRDLAAEVAPHGVRIIGASPAEICAVALTAGLR
jgi:NAD(P)-dependent dehydrogenase (short-subunit alcohol dehydrogenase family)